ncbi:MAG: hypothetical protein GY841_09080 [FCB group bacterium]|nr:hypothetical protein [FCB group bacterium]
MTRACDFSAAMRLPRRATGLSPLRPPRNDDGGRRRGRFLTDVRMTNLICEGEAREAAKRAEPITGSACRRGLQYVMAKRSKKVLYGGLKIGFALKPVFAYISGFRLALGN